jgi:hypothetical protein
MMRASRLSKFVVTIATVVGLGGTAEGASSDPLARPEFDQDITLSMPGSSVVRVYEAIASFARVPFILAFDESDPNLKVAFKAENMGVRAILASLAKSYGLEYASADGAILVTRAGQAPTEKRKMVGPWQPPVPLYRLQFLIRTRDGHVLSTPWVATGLKQEGKLVQAMRCLKEAPDLPAFGCDSRMEVELVPRKETAEGLELELHWAVHEGTTKTAGRGETLLFTTPQGYQLVLQEWSRRTPESGDGSDEQAR